MQGVARSHHVDDTMTACVHCHPTSVPGILTRMRQVCILLTGLLCAAAPALAQVTVDLHALDALPAAKPAHRRARTRNSAAAEAGHPSALPSRRQTQAIACTGQPRPPRPRRVRDLDDDPAAHRQRTGAEHVPRRLPRRRQPCPPAPPASVALAPIAPPPQPAQAAPPPPPPISDTRHQRGEPRPAAACA